ncbi:MAG: hypothetical protein HQK60_19265 [Deltaproteobacteria bacterium]|nr:hypothetical protein [Deltaproteobacteria bacterium]
MGKDIFKSPGPLFMTQFRAFIRLAFSYHWASGGSQGVDGPGVGMKRALERAGIVGVLHHFGFRPVSKEEWEHQQEEQQEEEATPL